MATTIHRHEMLPKALTRRKQLCFQGKQGAFLTGGERWESHQVRFRHDSELKVELRQLFSWKSGCTTSSSVPARSAFSLHSLCLFVCFLTALKRKERRKDKTRTSLIIERIRLRARPRARTHACTESCLDLIQH